MDQDSFRKLLQTPRPGGSTSSGSRGSFLQTDSWSTKPKAKIIDASQPAFKPRKVKKSQGPYRDRAAERRVGEGNDFADIEAVVEDFERRMADNEDKDAVEAQRRYLAGGKYHTILVQGLDLALLEQIKARAGQGAPEDDDSLEEAFREASTSTAKTASVKRTKEDIIKELKEKRAKGGAVEEVAKDEAVLMEDAKRAGKFKPIGFKPIGSSTGEKKKKKKREVEKDKDGERKKKKRKIEGGDKIDMPPPPVPSHVPAPVASPVQPAPEPELIPDDFDIFAGAGEYEGVDLGDEDEEVDENGEVATGEANDDMDVDLPRLGAGGSWFASDLPKGEGRATGPVLDGSRSTSGGRHRPDSPPEDGKDTEASPEPEQMMRLVPLQSSAIPSIKELLALDKAQDKNKYDNYKGKKKSGRKGGGKEVDGEEANERKKADLDAKVDRDYKRLKSYTEKKEKAGNASGTG